MYLDPDFRKDPDTSRPFCVRCQKPVDETQVVKVTVDWDNWQVSEGGVDLVGRDCWRKIIGKDRKNRPNG